jgi:PAS domain S-box-containing protein
MEHGLLDPASLQRMLYDALDHSDDIVLVLEQSGDEVTDLGIASANGAFLRSGGHRLADLIGRPFHTLVAEDADRRRWDEIVRTTRQAGSARAELLCRRNDGSTFWFGFHLMPVRGPPPPHFVVLAACRTELTIRTLTAMQRLGSAAGRRR